MRVARARERCGHSPGRCSSFVGKSWVNRFRMRDHERGRTLDNVMWDGEIKAYEDVTTPAGTFKAFKLVHENPYAQFIRWWSPDLGIIVK